MSQLQKLKYIASMTLFAVISGNLQASETSFIGTGNEALETDTLLIYPEAESDSLVYHIGQPRLFIVKYGANIDRKSVSVKLNGVDISKRFHPKENTEQRVPLDLVKGQNTLELSISDLGDIENGVQPKTDTDSFSITLDKTVSSARQLNTPPPGISKVELPETANASSHSPVFIDRSIR